MSTHQIDISDFERDPRLFLFTSLTAGSSHIITATSRMETILKANKIPFQAIDLATDEKARRLWQRRARERKLPGLVKEGFVVGDLDEVEEWNEFGELKENIGPVPSSNDSSGHKVASGVTTAPPIPVNAAPKGTTNISQSPAQASVNKAPKPGVDESKFRALPGAAEMAERRKAKSTSIPEPAAAAAGKGEGVVGDENAAPKGVETMASAPTEKQASVTAAKKLLREVQSSGDGDGGRAEHLSAPPSGIATPEGERMEAATTGQKAGRESAVEGDGEAEKLTHRGSEVKEAPEEVVEEVESKNAIGEAPEEVQEEGVGASDTGEGKAAEGVGAQSAKEGGDAGKSVGD